MGPEWTHIVGAIAALVAAVAAVLTFFVVAGAAFVALRQLDQAKSDSKDRLLADEARLMADLGRRWDDPLLFESRMEAADRSPPQLRYAIEMFYQAQSREYYVMIRVPNFFEDIGVMTREGTISESTVRKLFAGPVVGAWDRWKPAIDYLREASGREQLYEHFQWLSANM